MLRTDPISPAGMVGLIFPPFNRTEILKPSAITYTEDEIKELVRDPQRN